jgi:L-alanine-DL-glutamate epimerase-like enolase superfamily enzyme
MNVKSLFTQVAGLQIGSGPAAQAPWQFVAVGTDAGITGHRECSDGRNPCGVASTVHEFEAILMGRDPRSIERRYWNMYPMTRGAPAASD